MKIVLPLLVVGVACAAASLRAEAPADAPVTVRFQGAPLAAVLEAVAAAAGRPCLAPAADEFRESVTLEASLGADALFDLLGEHYGIETSEAHGVLVFRRRAAPEPVLRRYVLRHHVADRIDISSPSANATLQGFGSGEGGGASSGEAAFAVEGGRLVADLAALFGGGVLAREDPDANAVIVVASERDHARIAEYLERIDLPPEQVEFEAHFVETTRNPESDLGISWGNAVAITAGGEGESGFDAYRWPRAAVLTAYEFSAQLHWLAQDARSRVTNRPTLVGLNNRRATIDATRQIPVAQSTFNVGGTGATSSNTTLAFLDVGTIVNLWPRVLRDADGTARVLLHVSLVVSSLAGETEIGGNPTPLTARRRFEFTVLVPDGHTLAIGGLEATTQATSTASVPLLGDLPLAGRLFRRERASEDRARLVVAITPRVLPRDPGRPPRAG